MTGGGLEQSETGGGLRLVEGKSVAALLGLVLGLVTAAAVTQLMRSLLTNTQPLDAMVYVGLQQVADQPTTTPCANFRVADDSPV